MSVRGAFPASAATNIGVLPFYAPFVATVTKGVIFMQKNKKLWISVRMMATDAVLIAMYVVLNSIAIRTANIKFTLDAFPIIIGAVMFGPLHGTLIGFVGSAIYQLFFSGYGITPTTPLWMLPVIIRGLIVGLYSRRKAYEPPMGGLVAVTILAGVLTTTFNTLALYTDSIIYNYYSYELVFGLLIPKFVISVILAVVFALITPALVKKIRKNIKLPAGGK